MTGDAPRDRRWRDPDGTRRGSVEFGGKSPGREPRQPRGGLGRRRETRGERLSRRLRGAGRFAVRHRGSLTCLLGVLGTVLSLLLLEGLVQLISGVLTLGIVGAGAAVHHHQRNRTMNSSTSRRPSAAQVREHDEAMTRTGRPPTREPAGAGDTIKVKSHTNDGSNVKQHTRRKAGTGEAKAS